MNKRQRITEPHSSSNQNPITPAHDRFMKFPRPTCEEECYQVIYADPAWSYRDPARAGNRGAVCHYDTMTDEELQAMPVPQLAARDCILFLWATYPKLQEALDLVKAWGFTYKTVAFTWVKKTQKGTWALGMGRYTRSNAEICLLATKGHPKRESAAVRQIVESVREEHSKKPAQVRERIDELCGSQVKKIELFARERSVGWDAWGNEC